MCVQTPLFYLPTSPNTHPSYSCYFWLGSRAQNFIVFPENNIFFFFFPFLHRIPWNIMWLPSIVLDVRLVLYVNRNACFQNVSFSSLPEGSTVRLPSDLTCWTLHSPSHQTLIYGEKQSFWKSVIYLRSLLWRDFCSKCSYLNDGCNYCSEGVKGFRSFSVTSKEHKYI